MTAEWDHIQVDPARISPPPAIDGTFILDDIQAWFREHGGKVWPSEVRAHPLTNDWMRSQWSAPADTPDLHLFGELSSLGIPVRVDDTVPSGIVRTIYTDGTERDERVYDGYTALGLALLAFGREIATALRIDAFADWLNRRLTRGERP